MRQNLDGSEALWPPLTKNRKTKDALLVKANIKLLLAGLIPKWQATCFKESQFMQYQTAPSLGNSMWCNHILLFTTKQRRWRKNYFTQSINDWEQNRNLMTDKLAVMLLLQNGISFGMVNKKTNQAKISHAIFSSKKQHILYKLYQTRRFETCYVIFPLQVQVCCTVVRLQAAWLVIGLVV